MSALEDNSASLIDALSTRKDDIEWVPRVLDIYESIKTIYKTCATVREPPDAVVDLKNKVKELEKYLLIDLERHIATQNGRQPYYLHRVHDLLAGSLALLETNLGIANGASNRPFSGAHKEEKDFDHFSAALQAAFIEYGFCSTLDVLHEVEEITRALDLVSLKIDGIEKSMQVEYPDDAVLIADLHNAIAHQHGIQQSCTNNNLQKVRKRYDDITSRLVRLENNICRDKIKKESPVFKKYVESQRGLKHGVLPVLYRADPSDIINDHMVHPGTRGWLLERVNRWYHKSTKRVYYLGAAPGAGKTAMASTICKLYGTDVIACHFFSELEGETRRNHVSGLLQSLSSEMCRTLPEYSHYMGQRYGGDKLKAHLNGAWKDTYELLFKDPLRALYGAGQKDPVRRKLIVIDALDECSQNEWKDMRAFIIRFTSDLPARFCVFVTAGSKHIPRLVDVDDYEGVEGLLLDDRMWMNFHIKDVEIYLSSCLGAILSGEDDADTPNRAKADDSTLQKTVDEMLRSSAGRFDVAIELMESFAKEMRTSKGQFLSSLKKAVTPVRNAHGNHFDQRASDFASPFRAYRDKEGRSVVVRVMRQSQFPMDKTRVALIRSHHKMN